MILLFMKGKSVNIEIRVYCEGGEGSKIISTKLCYFL